MLIIRSVRNGVLFLMLVCLIFLAGCQSFFGAAPAAPPALSYSGNGPGEVQLDSWEGPAVLHLTASDGSQPFGVEITSGLDFSELVRSDSRVYKIDEYRGVVVAPNTKPDIRIEGDRTWKVDVFPVQAGTFDDLKIPGTYSGQGNSVIFLQGNHGVATFDKDQTERFEAWAIGESQKWERLKITETGDYKGKSVLPINTRMVIVSARGPWSVFIQEPCCDNITPKNKSGG